MTTNPSDSPKAVTPTPAELVLQKLDAQRPLGLAPDDLSLRRMVSSDPGRAALVIKQVKLVHRDQFNAAMDEFVVDLAARIILVAEGGRNPEHLAIIIDVLESILQRYYNQPDVASQAAPAEAAH
ncbi:MAG: hypothetical protein KGQ37_03665 [Hyphomicrobiales bacterium]|nr:hypothetical protein [Hyphomicrobiales bacterium]